MFIHRPLNVDRTVLLSLRRQVAVSVSKLVARPRAPHVVAVATTPTCENGVCMVNWKPQHPAA